MSYTRGRVSKFTGAVVVRVRRLAILEQQDRRCGKGHESVVSPESMGEANRRIYEERLAATEARIRAEMAALEEGADA